MWSSGKNFGATKKSTKNEIPEEEETRFKSTSLNTGLKPIFGIKTVHHGSENIKGLLNAAERTLLREALQPRRFECLNNKTR